MALILCHEAMLGLVRVRSQATIAGRITAPLRLSSYTPHQACSIWREQSARRMSRQNDEEYQMLMQPKPVTLVDHPDYEAPRLKTTWMQMLPRMACGCVILLVIVGAMVSVVWSVVSDAPGDPLHRKAGSAASATAIKQAALHASAKHRKEKVDQKKSKSPWEWIMGVLNRSV